MDKILRASPFGRFYNLQIGVKLYCLHKTIIKNSDKNNKQYNNKLEEDNVKCIKCVELIPNKETR